MSERPLLARNNEGTVIHRRTCRHARHDWQWAEGRPITQIVEVMIQHRYRQGDCCKPVFGEVRDE